MGSDPRIPRRLVEFDAIDVREGARLRARLRRWPVLWVLSLACSFLARGVDGGLFGCLADDLVDVAVRFDVEADGDLDVDGLMDGNCLFHNWGGFVLSYACAYVRAVSTSN